MLWRKRRKSEPEPGAVEEQQAAEERLEAVEQGMEAAQERASEIAEISRTLRRMRERNHFTPLVRDALWGREQ